jgi:hypothetical protein
MGVSAFPYGPNRRLFDISTRNVSIVIIVGHHLSNDIDASGPVGMSLSSSSSITDNVALSMREVKRRCRSAFFAGGGGELVGRTSCLRQKSRYMEQYIYFKRPKDDYGVRAQTEEVFYVHGLPTICRFLAVGSLSIVYFVQRIYLSLV